MRGGEGLNEGLNGCVSEGFRNRRHRALFADGLRQMKGGRTMSTRRSADLFHHGIAGCALGENVLAAIADKKLPAVQEAADLRLGILLHLAVDVFHRADAEIVDAVF